MDLQQQLGKKIIEAYSKTIFGKVSKMEIDLIVFSILAIENLKTDEELYNDETFNWFRLNSKHIRQLSIKLKITENKVSSLIEHCALLEMDEDKSAEIIIDEIKRLVKKTRQNNRDIQLGMIKLFVPNKFARSSIESLLAKSGGIPDSSFSQNILTIRLIDLISGIHSTVKDGEYLIAVAKESNTINKNEEINQIIMTASQKSGIEKVQMLSAAILKSFIGNTGEILSDKLFDVICKKF